MFLNEAGVKPRMMDAGCSAVESTVRAAAHAVRTTARSTVRVEEYRSCAFALEWSTGARRSRLRREATESPSGALMSSSSGSS